MKDCFKNEMERFIHSVHRRTYQETYAAIAKLPEADREKLIAEFWRKPDIRFSDNLLSALWHYCKDNNRLQ